MTIVGIKLKITDQNAVKALSLCGLSVLFTVIYNLVTNPEPITRLEGTLGNANLFALSLLIPWAYLLGHVISSANKQSKRIGVAALLIYSIAIFGTMTRSAWIACAACLLMIPFFYKNRNLYKFALGSLTVVALAIVTNIAGLKDRVLYSFDLATESAQGIRIAIWRMNWDIFLKHPIFGVGFFENYRIMPLYFDIIGKPNGEVHHHAHNQYLQTLVGSGIVGFVFYMLIWISAAYFFTKKAFSLKNNPQLRGYAIGSLMIIIAYSISSLTESPLLMHSARNFMLIFLGISFGVLQKEELQKSTSSQA